MDGITFSKFTNCIVFVFLRGEKENRKREKRQVLWDQTGFWGEGDFYTLSRQFSYFYINVELPVI